MASITFHRYRGPRVLYSYSIQIIFLITATSTVSALILSFILGSIFHPQLLYNYKWDCGTVLLPSVSRVINLPLERTIVQFFITSCLPFRLIVLLLHWINATQPEGSSSKLFILLKLFMLSNGIIEITCLACLSIIGERESGGLHVVLFMTFSFTTFFYFVSHLLIQKWQQNWDFRKNDECWLLRVVCTLAISISLPTIALLFILYHTMCMKYTYELFAVFEYLTIFFICVYHTSFIQQMKGSIVIQHERLQLKTIRM